VIATSAAADISLSLERVAVARGGRRIVDRVSFAVQPGDAVILRGPNGSGKTTLLRAIAGLAPVEAGVIALTVAGATLRSPSDLRTHIVHCGHADAVKPPMTVAENLLFWSRLYGASAARVVEALDAFDLAPLRNNPAANLSAGQRRRLALSRLIVSGKRVWLLDEPTSSVDAASAARLIELIERHLGRGGLAIVATHDKIAIENARSLVLTVKAAS
jgi:heme exporter protein A